MAGTGGGPGVIIGRVSVKVVPDLTKFKKEAQAKINELEKRLEAAVELVADATGLVEQADAEVEAAQARVKDLVVHVDMDDAGSVKAALAKIDAERRKLAAEPIHVPLDIDSLDAHFDALKKRHVTLQVDLDATAAALRLKELERTRHVDLKARVDKSFLSLAGKGGSGIFNLTGLAQLGKGYREFLDVLGNIGKHVPLIGSLALATAGLAGYALTAASNLFALSRSLAQIAQAGLALPGILGGIVIGLGITAAALKDFNKQLPEVGKQFKQLQNSLSANFWAEAKQPIQDFITTVWPSFSSGVNTAATSIGKFFAAFAGGLSSRLTPVLPDMFKALAKSIDIATAAGAPLAGIIATLGSVGASYLPRLARWFVDISTSFDAWLTAADNDGRLKHWINTGIRQLNLLGSAISSTFGILRGLAGAASDAGGSGLKQFAGTLEAVNKAVNSEGFQTKLVAVLKAAHQAMSNIATTAGPAFKEMISSVADILVKVMPLAGEAIGQLLKGFSEAMSQPEVAQDIITMFERLNTAAESFAGSMPAGMKVLAALGPLIGTVANTMALFTNAGNDASSNFSDLIGKIDNLAQVIGGVIADLLPKITPYFGVFADNIGKVVDALGPMIQSLGKAAGVILPVLLPIFQFISGFVWDSIASAIDGIRLAIDGLMQAVGGIVNIFKGAFDVIVGIFTGDGARIKDGFSKIWNGLKDTVFGVIKTIAGALWTWLNASIVGIFRGGFFRLLKLFTKSWKNIWKTVVDFIKSTLERFKKLPGKLWDLTKSLFSKLWDLFKNGLSKLRDLIVWLKDKAIDLFFKLGEKERSLVKTAWDKLKELFFKGVSKVWEIMKKLPGKIKSALGRAKTMLLNIGKSIIAGLIRGIQEKWDDLKHKVKDVGGSIKDGFKKVLHINSPSKVMIPIGEGVIEGIAVGMEKGKHRVKEQVTKLKDYLASIKLKFPAFDIAFNGPKSLSKAISILSPDVTGANNPWKKLKELAKDVAESGSKALKKMLRHAKRVIARQRDLLAQVNEDLQAAQERLADLKQQAADYAESVSSSLLDTFNPVGLGLKTFDEVKQSLKDSIAKTKAWLEQLKKLKSLGLNTVSFDQLVQAGPDAAGELAQSIIDAGQTGVQELNNLQNELSKVTGNVGNVASDTMFGAGIKAAEGVVEGLKQKQQQIIQTMAEVFAEALAKALSEMQMNVPSDTNVSTPKAGGKQGKHGKKHGGGGKNTNKSLTVVYNAAQGSSLSAEEELFNAVTRARMAGL